MAAALLYGQEPAGTVERIPWWTLVVPPSVPVAVERISKWTKKSAPYDRPMVASGAQWICCTCRFALP
jgi:hypothetical protein